MGCDIHSCAEVRHSRTGEWNKVMKELFPLDEHSKDCTNEPFKLLCI